MSLHKYAIFAAVVECGSLTRASEQLGLTQSAVSHALSSLEQEFGFSILTRSRSGVRVTSNGERMLAYMKEMLRCHEQMQQDAAAINGVQTGTVRIGTFTSVSTQWLPGILKSFQDRYPGVEIELYEGYYDEIEQWIASGEVDLGFVSLPTAVACDWHPLKRDRMLLIASADHPLATQETVDVAQLAEEPFIMPTVGCDNEIRRILQAHKLEPKIKYELGDDHAIIAMAASGLGISILPEMILFRLPPSIRAIPLQGDHYRTIGIAAASLDSLSPAAKRFFEQVQEWVSQSAD